MRTDIHQLLSRALAVTLVASLVITMPGTTAWAGTTNPTATQTSSQSPNQYTTVATQNNNNSFAMAQELLNLAGRMSNLFQPQAGASVAQQFAYENGVSGALNHNIGVQIQQTPLTAGEHIVTLDNGQQVILKSGQALVTDANGEQGVMDWNATVASIQKNDMEWAKSYLESGAANSNLGDETLAFYEKMNADNENLSAAMQGEQLQLFVNAFTEGGGPGTSLAQLTELEIQLRKQIQQQAWMANGISVRLQADVFSVQARLNGLSGGGSIANRPAINPQIDQLVNGKGNQLGYNQLLKNITDTQKNIADAQNQIAIDSKFGNCNWMPACSSLQDQVRTWKQQVETWKNQLDNINRQLCGAGQFSAGTGSGTFSSKAGAGFCSLSTADSHDMTAKGYIQVRDDLTGQLQLDQKNLALIKTNYFVPWQSDPNQKDFAVTLTQTWDPAFQPTKKGDQPPLISTQSALAKLESQFTSQVSGQDAASSSSKTPQNLSTLHNGDNATCPSCHSVNSTDKQLQQSGSDVNGLFPASGAHQVVTAANSALIQQDDLAHQNLMKLIQQKMYSDKLDSKDQAQAKLLDVQMAPYKNQGSASAWKRTKDLLDELKRTQDIAAKLKDNIDQVSKIESKIPACDASVSVMVSNPCAQQEAEATKAIAALLCKDSSDSSCIANKIALVSSPYTAGGFNPALLQSAAQSSNMQCFYDLESCNPMGNFAEALLNPVGNPDYIAPQNREIYMQALGLETDYGGENALKEYSKASFVGPTLDMMQPGYKAPDPSGWLPSQMNQLYAGVNADYGALNQQANQYNAAVGNFNGAIAALNQTPVPQWPDWSAAASVGPSSLSEAFQQAGFSGGFGYTTDKIEGMPISLNPMAYARWIQGTPSNAFTVGNAVQDLFGFFGGAVSAGESLVIGNLQVAIGGIETGLGVGFNSPGLVDSGKEWAQQGVQYQISRDIALAQNPVWGPVYNQLFGSDSKDPLSFVKDTWGVSDAKLVNGVWVDGAGFALPGDIQNIFNSASGYIISKGNTINGLDGHSAQMDPNSVNSVLIAISPSNLLQQWSDGSRNSDGSPTASTFLVKTIAPMETALTTGLGMFGFGTATNVIKAFAEGSAEATTVIGQAANVTANGVMVYNDYILGTAIQYKFMSQVAGDFNTMLHNPLTSDKFLDSAGDIVGTALGMGGATEAGRAYGWLPNGMKNTPSTISTISESMLSQTVNLLRGGTMTFLGGESGFIADAFATHTVPAAYDAQATKEIALQAAGGINPADIKVQGPGLAWLYGARAPSSGDIESKANNPTIINDVLAKMARSSDPSDIEQMAQMARGETITLENGVKIETPEALQEAANNANFDAVKKNLVAGQLAILASGGNLSNDSGGIRTTLYGSQIDPARIAEAQAVLKADSGYSVSTVVGPAEMASDGSGSGKIKITSVLSTPGADIPDTLKAASGTGTGPHELPDESGLGSSHDSGPKVNGRSPSGTNVAIAEVSRAAVADAVAPVGAIASDTLNHLPIPLAGEVSNQVANIVERVSGSGSNDIAGNSLGAGVFGGPKPRLFMPGSGEMGGGGELPFADPHSIDHTVQPQSGSVAGRKAVELPTLTSEKIPTIREAPVSAQVEAAPELAAHPELIASHMSEVATDAIVAVENKLVPDLQPEQESVPQEANIHKDARLANEMADPVVDVARIDAIAEVPVEKAVVDAVEGISAATGIGEVAKVADVVVEEGVPGIVDASVAKGNNSSDREVMVMRAADIIKAANEDGSSIASRRALISRELGVDVLEAGNIFRELVARGAVDEGTIKNLQTADWARDVMSQAVRKGANNADDATLKQILKSLNIQEYRDVDHFEPAQRQEAIDKAISYFEGEYRNRESDFVVADGLAGKNIGVYKAVAGGKTTDIMLTAMARLHEFGFVDMELLVKGGAETEGEYGKYFQDKLFNAVTFEDLLKDAAKGSDIDPESVRVVSMDPIMKEAKSGSAEAVKKYVDARNDRMALLLQTTTERGHDQTAGLDSKLPSELREADQAARSRDGHLITGDETHILFQTPTSYRSSGDAKSIGEVGLPYLEKIQKVDSATGYKVDRNSLNIEERNGTFDMTTAKVRNVSLDEFQANQETGLVYHFDEGSHSVSHLSDPAEAYFADMGITRAEAERILKGIHTRNQYTTAMDEKGSSSLVPKMEGIADPGRHLDDPLVALAISTARGASWAEAMQEVKLSQETDRDSAGLGILKGAKSQVMIYSGSLPTVKPSMEAFGIQVEQYGDEKNTFLQKRSESKTEGQNLERNLVQRTTYNSLNELARGAAEKLIANYAETEQKGLAYRQVFISQDPTVREMVRQELQNQGIEPVMFDDRYIKDGKDGKDGMNEQEKKDAMNVVLKTAKFVIVDMDLGGTGTNYQADGINVIRDATNETTSRSTQSLGRGDRQENQLFLREEVALASADVANARNAFNFGMRDGLLKAGEAQDQSSHDVDWRDSQAAGKPEPYGLSGYGLLQRYDSFDAMEKDVASLPEGDRNHIIGRLAEWQLEMSRSTQGLLSNISDVILDDHLKQQIFLTQGEIKSNEVATVFKDVVQKMERHEFDAPGSKSTVSTASEGRERMVDNLRQMQETALNTLSYAEEKLKGLNGSEAEKFLEKIQTLKAEWKSLSFEGKGTEGKTILNQSTLQGKVDAALDAADKVASAVGGARSAPQVVTYIRLARQIAADADAGLPIAESKLRDAQRAAAAVLAVTPDMAQNRQLALVAGAPDLPSVAKVFGIPSNRIQSSNVINNAVSSFVGVINQVSSYYALPVNANKGMFSKIGSALYYTRLGSNFTPDQSVSLNMQVLTAATATSEQIMLAGQNILKWAQMNPNTMSTVSALTDQEIQSAALKSAQKEKTSIATLERQKQVTQTLENVRRIAVNIPSAKVEMGDGFTVVQTQVERNGQKITAYTMTMSKASEDAMAKENSLSDLSVASKAMSKDGQTAMVEVNIRMPKDAANRLETIMDSVNEANRQGASIFVAQPGENIALRNAPQAKEGNVVDIAQSHEIPSTPIGTSVRRFKASVRHAFTPESSGSIRDLENSFKAAQRMEDLRAEQNALISGFGEKPSEAEIGQFQQKQTEIQTQQAHLIQTLERTRQTVDQLYRTLPALHFLETMKEPMTALITSLKNAPDNQAALQAITDYQNAVGDAHLKQANLTVKDLRLAAYQKFLQEKSATIQAGRRSALTQSPIQRRPSFTEENPEWSKQITYFGLYSLGAVAAFVYGTPIAAGAAVLVGAVIFARPAWSLMQSFAGRLSLIKQSLTYDDHLTPPPAATGDILAMMPSPQQKEAYSRRVKIAAGISAMTMGISYYFSHVIGFESAHHLISSIIPSAHTAIIDLSLLGVAAMAYINNKPSPGNPAGDPEAVLRNA